MNSSYEEKKKNRFYQHEPGNAEFLSYKTFKYDLNIF